MTKNKMRPPQMPVAINGNDKMLIAGLSFCKGLMSTISYLLQTTLGCNRPQWGVYPISFALKAP